MSQGGAGGVVSTHPVDSSPRWGGGGAEVHALGWCPVGIERKGGAKEELLKIIRSPADIAPDQIGVRFFHLGGVPGGSGQDQVAKAGGEPFYLGFYGAGY